MKAAYRTKEVYLPDRGDTRDPKAVRHSKSKAKSQLPSHEVLCWPGLPGWLWQDMSWRNLSQKNLSFRGLLTLNICLRIQFQLHLPKRLMPSSWQVVENIWMSRLKQIHWPVPGHQHPIPNMCWFQWTVSAPLDSLYALPKTCWNQKVGFSPQNTGRLLPNLPVIFLNTENQWFHEST